MRVFMPCRRVPMNPTIGQVASRNWHERSASQPHSLNGRPRSCQLQAAREVSKPRPFSAIVWSVLVRGSGEPVWPRFPEGRQAVALSNSWAPSQLKQCEVSPTCLHVAQGRAASRTRLMLEVSLFCKDPFRRTPNADTPHFCGGLLPCQLPG